MGYSVPTDEQETTINFSRSENVAYIWTSDTTIMTKLDKLCEKSPEFYQLQKVGKVSGSIVNKEYFITDKTLVSFRSGKVKREMTEEQKEAASKRMKDLHLKGAL